MQCYLHKKPNILLALRGVELPDGLKDEVVMIVSERRTATL